MRRLLFRAFAATGAGPLLLQVLERLRRIVGSARALRLRRRLAARGIVDHHVGIDGSAAFVLRDPAGGSPSWAETARRLAEEVAAVDDAVWCWERVERELGPTLAMTGATWRSVARAIHDHGIPSWMVERTGPGAPVRSVLESARSLDRLGAGAPPRRLRLYDAVGTGGRQPFGRGLAINLSVVERPSSMPVPLGDPLADIGPPFPIDVVHTWVDGSDPAWNRRRRAALPVDHHAVDARSDERFLSRDELRFSLRSVDTYAPWVRHHYLVTDQQRPAWLDSSSDRVTVIDHRDIIDADCLPTFNSHVIEACLHRIPGLAEHYIYFNDDVFLGRALGWSAFFDDEGRSRFYPSPAEIPVESVAERSIDAATMNGRRLLDRRFGVDASNKMRHTPHPQRRTTHVWMEREFPTERRTTLESRFRSIDDHSFASFLHHYVGEQLGLAVRGEVTYDYVGLDRDGLDLRLRGILRRTDPFDTFCLNDGVVDPAARPTVDRLVREFLAAAYPFPASWER